MQSRTPLRVIFLIGGDSPSTRLAIESVCRLAGVVPVAAFVDVERPSWKRRMSHLRRNVRRHGWSYLLRRCAYALRTATDNLADRAVVSRADVLKLLRRAFPDRCFSLNELAGRYGFSIRTVANLNSPEAVVMLQEAGADLGIVLGTRILKPGSFTVPRLGCLNLHKGKVPEYRGMPPGFWELYDGASTAGVTVHFVDRGLDTGDVVVAREFPIHPLETPESLLEKLHQEGARSLAAAVAAIRDGAQGRPQPEGRSRTRSKPSPAQVRELQEKLPHWKRRGDGYAIRKNLYALLLYYSGVYRLARAVHSRYPSRAAIILYHRVNDYSKDVLTVDTETFAGHLLTLSRHYRGISTGELVEALRGRKPIHPTAVAIHFDDCYRDVLLNGAPLLAAAGFPATAFISSGFVDTDRAFGHDLAKYPFRYENLRSGEIGEWIDRGFDIGAHTVNHVDLGRRPLEEARAEVVDSGRRLAELSGRPVKHFSFPFGAVHHIRDEVVGSVREAGYEALFSAHGGFIGPATDLFDIPRWGAHFELKPLYLLLEMEGLAIAQIAARLRRLAKPRV
jgi:peptidoglycan/xylan/chitin deacetylase (PgdA/CDA1 family)